MKLKASIVLVLAALWGLGSWWWYTCKIKGFCSMEAQSNTTAVAPNPATKSTTLSDDDTQDNDKDGIRNGDEKRLGTDPNNPDSDEDGVPDLVEISQIPNDTDGDGLIDALDDDDDNDGILTKDESPDRNNDGRVDDALDSDKDGVPDYLQVASNTQPESQTTKEASATTTKPKETKDEATSTVVTTVVEDGSVDIYRPEAQASAMTAEEEKHLNKGTPSPAPVVPATPKDSESSESNDTETTASTSTELVTPITAERANKVQRITDTPISNTAVESITKPAAQNLANAETNASKTAPIVTSTATTSQTTKEPDKTSDAKAESETESKPTDEANTAEQKAKKDEPEPQDPEGKDRNKMVVYQNGKSTDDRLGPARLNFPTGLARPTLTDETAEYFDTVAAYLKKHKRATIKITGHTDNRGDADLNKQLALKRAEIVRDALVRRGAPEKQLQVSSMGESKPIASNNTAEGRQQNRRVEVMPLK